MKHVTFNAFTGEHREEELGSGEDDREDLDTQSVAVTQPYTILNPWDTIRSFSPRKHGRPGTRIVFRSGAGLPVKETHEEVLAALSALNN